MRVEPTREEKGWMKSSRAKNEGTYRSGEGAPKSLPTCDAESELRLRTERASLVLQKIYGPSSATFYLARSSLPIPHSESHNPLHYTSHIHPVKQALLGLAGNGADGRRLVHSLRHDISVVLLQSRGRSRRSLCGFVELLPHAAAAAVIWFPKRQRNFSVWSNKNIFILHVRLHLSFRCYRCHFQLNLDLDFPFLFLFIFIKVSISFSYNFHFRLHSYPLAMRTT